jgi:hypothetical protein
VGEFHGISLSVMPGIWMRCGTKTLFTKYRGFVGPTLDLPHSVGETVVSPNAHLIFGIIYVRYRKGGHHNLADFVVVYHFPHSF